MAEKASADVGLIGLAVMGQNLALNMADHGFKVTAFNRTTRVMKEFIAANPDTPGGLSDAKTFRNSWLQSRSRARSSFW